MPWVSALSCPNVDGPKAFDLTWSLGPEALNKLSPEGLIGPKTLNPKAQAQKTPGCLSGMQVRNAFRELQHVGALDWEGRLH